MQISWLGMSSFEITTKTPNGEVKLVMDPYDNATGLRFPRTLVSDITTISHKGEDADNIGAIGNHPFVIDTNGEFEVKGVFVYSIPAGSKESPENRLMRLEAEDMTIAHLGAIDRELSDQELAELENVDILMVPVGGGRVLDAKKAVAVINQVEPRVVIPMTYGIENVKEKLASVEDFCKELRVCRREEATKYKVSRKDLPEEETVIMVLSR